MSDDQIDQLHEEFHQAIRRGPCDAPLGDYVKACAYLEVARAIHAVAAAIRADKERGDE